MRIIWLLVVAALVSAGLIQGAFARDLRQDLSSQKEKPIIQAVFAVGKEGKANHDAVGLTIRGEAAPLGLSLELGTTEGSAQSAEAVCQGVAQFAVGQWDTLVRYIEDSKLQCKDKLLRVSVPTYNYSLYVVARADAPFNSLEEMKKYAEKGQPVRIAAGTSGSGGQDTMTAIARMLPDYNISITYDGGDVAPAMVESKQVMAYAIMDAPDSETVQKLTKRIDSATKKPVFKFLNVSLPSKFYKSAVDQTGAAIYSEGKIPTSGWFTSNITTLTVPAALVIEKSFAYQQPKALEAFTEAGKRAQAAITAAVAPKN